MALPTRRTQKSGRRRGGTAYSRAETPSVKHTAAARKKYRFAPHLPAYSGDVAYEPDGFRVLASDHEALLARAFAEDAKRG